ncbi:MAG: sugar transferase [Pseudomonadota bacterium]
MYIHQSTVDFGAPSKTDDARNAAAKVLSRIRTQLAGGIIMAIVLPGLAVSQMKLLPIGPAFFDNSFIGAFCALLIGFMMYRKVTALPGANAILSVVPAFVMSYGLVIVLFFMLRLEYSRPLFVLSFGFVTTWFMLVLVAISRLQRPVMSYVPEGMARDLCRIKSVRWIEVAKPDKIVRGHPMPLVVDLNAAGLSEQWERAIAEEAVAGRPIFNAKQLNESLSGRVQIEHLSENTFGHLSVDTIYAPAKRYIDVMFAAIALVFFAPLMLLLAAIIRIDSRGPAVFRQTRMGYRGQTFTVYKFRSMRERSPNADRAADMTQSDDDRITRVGRFIRKTRLDELPQVLNILKGEMSWIGPRPEALRLSEWYENEIAFYRYRHIVRPGITGWAQVKQGHVVDVDDVKEKLEYDLYYIKHFSVWMDFMIALKTVQVILTGHGAK